jgi:hypothetical protein
MSEQEPKSLIGLKTAFILYAVLIGLAIATLKGKPLALAVIIVLALAAKSYVDHLRRRLK